MMKVIMRLIIVILLAGSGLLLVSCKHKLDHANNSVTPVAIAKKAMCCESNIPKRFASLTTRIVSVPVLNADKSHKGMVWIKAGTFMMGADNKQASPDEYPKHKVTVNGFWMDVTEVTNAEFARFFL